MSDQLNVLLHDRLVATITNAPGDVNYVAIDRDFANDPTAATLSFRAFRDPVTHAYRENIRPTQTVLHPFFSNLLPEGALRSYLAAHARVTPKRDFPLLWLLGRDLPGALVMRDAAGAELPPQEELEAANPADVDANMLRFSLAGVQLKLSAGGDPARGLTIPVKGMGGRWIVKLPDQRFRGVPENEFSMMTFAKTVGINVPKNGLATRNVIRGVPNDVRFVGNAYFVERFDRTENDGRIHTEDFAQANNLFPAQKYTHFNFDQLLTQTAALMGSDVAMEMLERIVFSIGIGNGDMHAKNWSVIYYDGRTPSLAPAYDFVSTILYMPRENLGMNLAGTKSFIEIDMDRILSLASTARLSLKMAELTTRRMIERIRDFWPTINLAIEPEDHARITKHMDSVPLFNGTQTVYSIARRNASTAAAASGTAPHRKRLSRKAEKLA